MRRCSRLQPPPAAVATQNEDRAALPRRRPLAAQTGAQPGAQTLRNRLAGPWLCRASCEPEVRPSASLQQASKQQLPVMPALAAARHDLVRRPALEAMRRPCLCDASPTTSRLPLWRFSCARLTAATGTRCLMLKHCSQQHPAACTSKGALEPRRVHHDFVIDSATAHGSESLRLAHAVWAARLCARLRAIGAGAVRAQRKECD